MTQATAPASVTSQTIAVEHIRISSRRPFAEVRRKLEDTVPQLDTGIAQVLRSGDQEPAKIYEDNGPRLSIFAERDHGSLLQIWGSRRNAVQYEIGNPLTASKMTRHQLALLSTRRYESFCSRTSRAGESSNMTGHRRSLASMAMST
jgi:hypothetical protein